MRRAVLIALALIAVLSLVPSGSGRGRANEKIASRWYKLSVHFSGSYKETGGHDLTLSTAWSALTDPFKLELQRGRVTFYALNQPKFHGKGTLQSATLAYATDMGAECPKAERTTYKQDSENLYFSWHYDPAINRVIPRGHFSDFSHGHTERHCSAARPPDYVGPQRVGCADIKRDSSYPYGECFARGADDSFAQSILVLEENQAKAEEALFRVRVSSGRLGRDFSLRTSLVRSIKDKAARGGPERTDIHYVYSFKFRVCPSHGLTKKRC